MGASVQTLTCHGVKSGNPYSVSLYFAGSDAAGYTVPCSQYLAATAASPTEFSFPEPVVITSISGPATGTLTLMANGVQTPIKLNTAVIISKAANPAAKWGNLKGGETRYRLIVEVAMAA